ncbi:hypothetical protein XELAEV_18004169mg [Xenopus laevis]|uniref:UPAR/Ly6 domain-containing protein n=1 Tax=Xenopus laevis TaxID=8355 RepID=A0A974GZW0_XENLA|nr:hypothetical protein XELAEV_18004169mg [Xenopus laevis]
MGIIILLFGLLVLMDPGNALSCYNCMGEKGCKGKVTCHGENATCSTSVLTISSFPLSYRSVSKSCLNTPIPSRASFFSPSRTVRFSLQETTCSSDLCNNQTKFGNP